ncbi:hypothetical protein BDZ94DRAFT_427511 [Collybia nuda]|uniref:Uncharacterized protein n=1 Tax=Collybia nuda TaxID=64659 RepID=A0A9P5YC69_9AGAR|nr:hypothetical protein BDZ94DRAFT_427511 [Collybia nuda]
MHWNRLTTIVSMFYTLHLGALWVLKNCNQTHMRCAEPNNVQAPDHTRTPIYLPDMILLLVVHMEHVGLGRNLYEAPTRSGKAINGFIHVEDRSRTLLHNNSKQRSVSMIGWPKIDLGLLDKIQMLACSQV